MDCEFLLFYFLNYLFIFGSTGSLLLPGLFYSCDRQGLLSGCSVQVSHSLSPFFFFFCGGLSCCKKWTVGCVGFTACGFWTLEHWFNSCGIQALLLDGMWDLPGSGIKPISPTVAGGFFTLSQRGGLYQEKS